MKKGRGAITRTATSLLVATIIVIAGGAIYYEAVFSPAKPSVPLLVFSADLYTPESSYLYSGFSNSTGTPYAAPKSAGSFALATQIEQGSPVSVFISVSKSALESAYLGNRAPGWGIAFASDQMTIGYSNSTSPTPGLAQVLADYHSASTSNSTADWRTFFTDLTSGSVKVGVSNPNTDPAGYRAWIVLEAAGQLYAGSQSFFVDRLLGAKANVTGTSAAALVAPLRAGQVQVLFMYLSAATSHGLTPIHLSRHINLGDSSLANYYSKYQYALSSGVQKGGPILLFITVPLNSTETSNALNFVVYVVQHASSMSKFGLVTLGPAKLYNSTDVPAQISRLLSAGSLVQSGQI